MTHVFDPYIARLQKEKTVMLRCAELNAREDGASIYSQRAIQCAKALDVLEWLKTGFLMQS